MVQMNTTTEQKLLASALQRLETLQRQESFDPQKPESRPTEKQLQVITDFGRIPQQWIRAGNQSGKSQTCARIVAWFVTDTHPNWKKPSMWGNEPLLVIVAGRTGKQIEDSLLPKIRGFLEPGTYKEVRVGNIIQRLELDNGNRIIFQSLENPNVSRERLQSYVAHLTWCDELPPTMDLVRELLVRTQARNGYALFSFTPTIVSTEIQKYVDGLKEPEGKVYRFNMLDNPLYADPERRQQLIDRYSYLSEDKRLMVFEGGWLSADGQVYHFDFASMVEMPLGYSPLWRHVESVDPAISSATGISLWAENPSSGMWYCVKVGYIKGILVPTEIVEAVQKFVGQVNVVRRTSDYAPWFVNTAAGRGIIYMTVQDKNNDRKEELIKNFQEALGKEIKIAPHCVELIEELQTCRWSDKGEGRIVNHSSFHIIDSAQYFVDIKPRKEKVIVYASQDEYLYLANEKRKADKYKKEQKIQRIMNRRRR
jgi:phage terminase large subunit-like protein